MPNPPFERTPIRAMPSLPLNSIVQRLLSRFRASALGSADLPLRVGIPAVERPSGSPTLEPNLVDEQPRSPTSGARDEVARRGCTHP